MGGPVDRGRKTIKKEQDKASPAVAEFEGPHQPLVLPLSLQIFRYLAVIRLALVTRQRALLPFLCVLARHSSVSSISTHTACVQGAGAGKGVLGTNLPLLKEQQETELERGHDLVKVEPPATQPPNKRPRAGMPGSSVPPEDVRMVQEGDRQASLAVHATITMQSLAQCSLCVTP